MKIFVPGVLMMSLLLHALTAAALEIRNVRHDRDVLKLENRGQVTIQFTLSEPASVTLNLYDGRDLLIRNMTTEQPLAAGEHDMIWDGKDQVARAVPPGAYHYTVHAKTEAGEIVEHDLTDLTGGEDIQVKDIRWDLDQGKLRYVLTANARVNIRLGLKNGGPLLRTLINWVPRQGGVQVETWDSKDESGVLDLSRHPQLMIGIQAFSLSDNTILVDPHETSIWLIEELTWGETKRKVKKAPKKLMYAHAQQPLETRGDFTIELKLPTGLPRNKEGVPIVSGTVPIRLDIDQKDRARAFTRRFEHVFYLDGVFVFENETGFLPMTWNWDARNVNPGIHYLTANLRGYEGNFGIATLKVYVQPEKDEIDDKPHS